MTRIGSLLKACLTEDMNIFNLRSKKKTTGKKALPVLLALLIGGAVWGYANMMLDSLLPSGSGFVMLTLFAIITSLLTLIEGVYKSGSLLFNCTDDNLMLSLPIKRSTVLFVRVFKLYVFEMLYNALFLVPAMIAYAMRVDVSWSFYLTSIMAILLLPIIPIVIACPIGAFISAVSSRFRMKNIAQIVLTVAIALIALYISWNLEGVFQNIAAHAESINDFITKIYYPVGAYISMITDFSWVTLAIFIAVNIAAFTLMCLILGVVYFRINSRAKITRVNKHHNEHKIKSHKVMVALVKKELRKFIDSPVFVVNAGFSLVLFVIGTILISVNYQSLAGILNQYGMGEKIDEVGEMIRMFAPLVLMSLLLMGALMGSITSSMISLEGKSFNILKSLPVKPWTIIMGKVLTAVLIMLPFLIIGDVVMIVRFGFNLPEILLTIVATLVFPMVAELIGIIVNLKYPKMNAKNDAEVVKQSASSTVAVFLGLGMLGVSAYLIIQLAILKCPTDLIMGGVVTVYTLIMLGLILILKRSGNKMFMSIDA